MNRRFLSGLPEDARKAFEELGAEGWTGEKTGGGHIKLMHPKAPKPVFAASTPSCSRSVKNTTALCRRMLRSATTMTATVEEVASDFEIPAALEIGRRRKDKPRHASRPEIPEIATGAAPLMEQTPEPMRKEEIDMTSASDRIETVEEDVAPAAATPLEIASRPTEERPEPPVEERSPIQVDADAGSDRRKVKAAAPSRPARTETGGGGVDRVAIDAKTLELVLSVIQGSLPRIRITSDMVGQVLVWKKNRFVLVDMPGIDFAEDLEPQRNAAQATPESEARGRRVTAHVLRRRERLIEILGTFQGDWMTVRDICAVDASPLFGSTERSRETTVRNTLKDLVEAGSVRMQEGERAAGSPSCAARFAIAT
jgi:hypothetical protein